MEHKLPATFAAESFKKEVDNTLSWEAPSTRNPKSLRRWHLLTTHCLVSLTTAFLCWAFWTQISFEPALKTPKTKILTCGNSTEEARALGCVFDLLTVAWIPAPCFKPEFTQSYLAESPWEYYTDKTSSELLDTTQMEEYTAPNFFFTSAREHAVHCLFAMEKLHTSYLRSSQGLYVDSLTANFKHTSHCMSVVKKAIDTMPEKLEAITTINAVELLTCEVEI